MSFNLALMAVLLIGCSLAAAADVPPANHICQAKQLEVFSCRTSPGHAFGICLDKATLRMTFARRSGHHPVSINPLDGVKEATLGENAHGDEIVLTATESGRSIELFVDGDRYDMQSPILLTKAGSHTRTEMCAVGTVVINSAVVTVGGQGKAANLFSLGIDGIVSTLQNPPDWPEPPSHNNL